MTRLEAFRSEVLRLCAKYVEYYEELDMPNTANAFREIEELAIAAKEDPPQCHVYLQRYC